MQTVLIAIGTLLPMLLILVVIHELGHFFTARALGVKVLEFGVGFPPRAFGIFTGKTPVLIDAATEFVNLRDARIEETRVDGFKRPIEKDSRSSRFRLSWNMADGGRAGIAGAYCGWRYDNAAGFLGTQRA